MEAESPLIGDLRPIALMLDEFANNEGFYVKVQHLHGEYSEYRKTRRDGSCFYRALAFSIFEKVVARKDHQLKAKMQGKLKDAKDFLIKAAFEGMVFEDMQALFLEKLEDPKMTMVGDVQAMFCDPTVSNYIVLMLRFITSGELKNNSILYETFIDNGLPIEFFCQTEVEPLDKEADQIQIMALLNYLDVAIKIIYLDSNVKSKEAYKVILPESAKPEEVKTTLLYRPGHYDILY